MHVDSVMRNVPEEERCVCNAKSSDDAEKPAAADEGRKKSWWPF